MDLVPRCTLLHHRLYDQIKEEHFYSLLLLFVPVINEQDLVENNESAENVLSKFIESNRASQKA